MSRGKREREPSDTWKRAQALVTDDARAYTRISYDLADTIQLALQEKQMSQVELARLLGKSPSEVNKLLSPMHNLTIKTVAKLEVALGVTLLVTPMRYQAMQESASFGSKHETDHYRAIRSQKESLATATFTTSTQVEQVLSNQTTTINISEYEELQEPIAEGNPSYAMAA